MSKDFDLRLQMQANTAMAAALTASATLMAMGPPQRAGTISCNRPDGHQFATGRLGGVQDDLMEMLMTFCN